MLATILAFFTGLFKVLPLISSWFKTTQAETQNTTAQKEQDEAAIIKKTGRPTWE